MSEQNNLLQQISARAITALILERPNLSTYDVSFFVRRAHELVFDHPSDLTEEWIKRINRWADDLYTSLELDESNSTSDVGTTLENLGPLTVIKKINRYSKKRRRLYTRESFFDYIAVDEYGWKFWFRIFYNERKKDFNINELPGKGSKIIFLRARVNDNKTGITFLRETKEYVVLSK